LSHSQDTSSLPDGDRLIRLLAETTQDYAIFTTDAEGRVLSWNPGAEAMFGWTRSEMIGRPVAIIFTPEDRARGVPEQVRALAAAEGQARGLRWHLHKDGTRLWVRDVLLALRDEAGVLSGYGKILRDATTTRQIEEALAVSEERQRLAIEAADIGTWHWDLVADTLLWSDRCKAIFGLPHDAEMSYERFLSLLHPGDREMADRASARALHDRTEYDIEYRVLHPDGEVRWVHAKGRGYYDDQGRPLRFEGVVQDITERKRAAQEMAERAARESLLNRIGAALRASLDPDAVQVRALTILGEGLGADRYYYSLFDEASDSIRISQGWRRDDPPTAARERRISDFRVTLEEVYGSGRTMVADDVRSAFSPEAAAALEASGVRSLISVPFFDGERRVAALTVAMADRSRAWTAGEVSLVEIAATQIRAAVEAARHFQREQNIALSLQEALQPALPRRVAGMDLAFFYKSALQESSVGGDFADVFTLDKGCTALVVGDLSGKGLAAAAQVATVRNMLRSVIYMEPTLAEAVTRLNGVITRQGLLTGFVTLFVACYDAGERALRYVSCGHEPGLVRRAATGRVEELAPTGPIFGADEGVRYEEATVSLHPGDMLLLYTDGLTEAGPSRREFLGVAGMARLLETSSAQDASSLVAEIITGVRAYAQDVLRDDACLLAGTVL